MVVQNLSRSPVSTTASKVNNLLEQLNEAMAVATALESTDAYLNAGEKYQSLLSKELYRCQNLIDRFQIHLINQKDHGAVVDSSKTSIYLREIKTHTIKLNVIVAKLKK